MRRLAPWTAFALFGAAMATLSLLRYESYHSRSLDMAYYVRLVWGIAHGHLDQPIVGAPHLLGLHLEPVLLPLAALARLGLPVAETLLVLQAFAAAAAIFPAAALARRHLAPHAGERAAFAAALTIYLLPTVTRCIDYDFHPSTMAIWPLLALVEAVDAGRWRAAWGWFAAALACREDVGLQVACLALTVVVRPLGADRARARRSATAMAAAGTAWFLVYTLAIQPRWLPPAGQSSYQLHFAHFGGSGGAGAIFSAAVADPVGLARYLVAGDRLFYPALLLLQVAFLPLLAPRWLAGALPIVAINLLSAFPRIRTLQAHYVTAAAPFIAAAAICGAGRLARVRPLRLAAPAALVAAAALAWLLRGASPWSPEWRAANYRDDDHARRARAAVAGVAPDAAVAAPHRVLAHLAERRGAYLVEHAPPGSVVVFVPE